MTLESIEDDNDLVQMSSQLRPLRTYRLRTGKLCMVTGTEPYSHVRGANYMVRKQYSEMDSLSVAICNECTR